MTAEIRKLRDELIGILHEVADAHDRRAAYTMCEGDTDDEKAHRGAAIGLRMAAGIVCDTLTGKPAPDPQTPTTEDLP